MAGMSAENVSNEIVAESTPSTSESSIKVSMKHVWNDLSVLEHEVFV